MEHLSLSEKGACERTNSCLLNLYVKNVKRSLCVAVIEGQASFLKHNDSGLSTHSKDLRCLLWLKLTPFFLYSSLPSLTFEKSSVIPLKCDW